jgi:hypothetical protein
VRAEFVPTFWKKDGRRQSAPAIRYTTSDRLLAGTMPNVKNLDKLFGMFDSIEYPEWAAGDLANVASGPSPINWPNLRETCQNADMVHDLVTHSYRSRHILLSDVPYQRFEVLERWIRPDYPEVHDRMSSRTSS